MVLMRVTKMLLTDPSVIHQRVKCDVFRPQRSRACLDGSIISNIDDNLIERWCKRVTDNVL
jgi:hypothetical protein